MSCCCWMPQRGAVAFRSNVIVGPEQVERAGGEKALTSRVLLTAIMTACNKNNSGASVGEQGQESVYRAPHLAIPLPNPFQATGRCHISLQHRCKLLVLSSSLMHKPSSPQHARLYCSMSEPVIIEYGHSYRTAVISMASMVCLDTHRVMETACTCKHICLEAVPVCK